MAGERAAQIMSLLETAKRNGLEPHAWLTDVLTRLPEWPEERLADASSLMSLDPLACGHDNVKQSKIVALTVSLRDKKAQYSRWQPDNLTVDAETK